MKEEDNFNFDDDFESLKEDAPAGDKNESDLLPNADFDVEGMDAVEEEPKAKVGSGLVDFLKSNLLFIVIGLAGAGVAGYLTYGILFPAGPAKPAPTQQVQNKGFGLKPVVPEPTASANNANQTTAPAQATTPNANMPPAQSANNPAVPLATNSVTPTITMSQQDIKTLMQGFAKIVNESSQNIYTQMQTMQSMIEDVGQASLVQQKQTAQVANDLNNLQQTMQTLAVDLNTYNKNMEVIGQQLGKTQQQLALLLAEQSATVQKLTLRAVVPGRAWLVDDQGNTTTVTVGTALPNYGTVVNIDSGKGEVIMSTGYVFK
ncbi:MAG: hypothetical protein K0Q57_148 [Gammaproteobacteria bacterium]|nr:hypothetical protein [Gammaproteobacteria bacterium]